MPKLQAGGVVMAAFLAVVLVLQAAALPSSKAPLVAHEWGTFTALQDDDGSALGAINADDEPVPSFVCTAGSFRTFPAASQEPRVKNSKALIQCHPDVTMRLETPVIYFYPPDREGLKPFNVRVTFRGGWLTEFYPVALVDAPDLTTAKTAYPPMAPTTSGALAWSGVELSAAGDLMPTNDPVWTAPREVEKAAVVTVAPPADAAIHYLPSKPEKFLFYRGVGHLNSPLRVVRDTKTDRLSLYADHTALNPRWRGSTAPDMLVPAAWLIEIRPEDGACAFRPVNGALDLGAPAGQPLASLPASFAPGEFSAGHLQALRAEMQTALIAAGLFPDEAAAMLKTWELSYFKSPGRRVLYVTPRDWVDQVLPLAIDGAQINRAMMGRVELISPAQRELLARIAAGPCPDMKSFLEEYYRKQSEYAQKRGEAEQARNRQLAAAGLPPVFFETRFSELTMEELNLSAPEVYQSYLQLGRFRDALVLNEQQKRPTEALAAFIAGNALQVGGN